MKCLFCNQEMIKGRAVNATIRPTDLTFKSEEDKWQVKDIFKEENHIFVAIGESVESYYCDNCNKYIMITERERK